MIALPVITSGCRARLDRRRSGGMSILSGSSAVAALRGAARLVLGAVSAAPARAATPLTTRSDNGG